MRERKVLEAIRAAMIFRNEMFDAHVSFVHFCVTPITEASVACNKISDDLFTQAHGKRFVAPSLTLSRRRPVAGAGVRMVRVAETTTGPGRRSPLTGTGERAHNSFHVQRPGAKTKRPGT